MLISPIDRNEESGPEKQISRINSPFWTLPAGVRLGTSGNTRTPHSSEGMILRVRDTRLMERRKSFSKFMGMDRRKNENRKHDSRWNSDSHHILVIAIERNPGEPDLWRNGDRVTVVPRIRTSLAPSKEKDPSGTETSRIPLLTKNEEDYVVHLSGRSPDEINEANR